MIYKLVFIKEKAYVKAIRFSNQSMMKHYQIKKREIKMIVIDDALTRGI